MLRHYRTKHKNQEATNAPRINTGKVPLFNLVLGHFIHNKCMLFSYSFFDHQAIREHELDQAGQLHH